MQSTAQHHRQQDFQALSQKVCVLLQVFMEKIDTKYLQNITMHTTFLNKNTLFFFFLLSFFQFLALRAQQPAIDSILKLVPGRVMTTSQVELIAGRNNGAFTGRMQSIDKLTAAQLATLPVRSLPEALSYVGGVDVRQRGLSGTQADIGIRG
ncbi:MAG: hypothetical protein RLZ93_1390, partial [Bacteroidota bacterium]